MKLLELNINGFGQLQNVTMQLDAPLVVVYGHNGSRKKYIVSIYPHDAIRIFLEKIK